MGRSLGSSPRSPAGATVSRPDDRRHLSSLAKQGLGAIACLRCGYCCRTAVCAFGTWDAVAHRCVHLTPDSECAIYERITALPRERWIGNPAFGAGCCSSLNSDRRALAERLAGSGGPIADRRKPG